MKKGDENKKTLRFEINESVALVIGLIILFLMTR